MIKLTLYVLTALLYWQPPAVHRQEGQVAARARYEAIASDIAAVISDASEPPLYPGKEGRERGALVIAAIGFMEGGLFLNVDNGDCNRKGVWCDHGIAWSLWQIHTTPALGAEDGITFDGTGFIYARERSAAWKLEHTSEIIHGVDLVRDRKIAIRLALHLARRSIDVWTLGQQSKALAARYLVKHPIE